MNCTTIYHNIRESAAFFKELGTNVLPIHRVDGKPTKGPRTTGWTKAAADGHSLDDFQDDDNGGVLLGGEKHLYDFDGDSEIARKLAAQRLSKLFPDLFRFGRKSTDYSSHYLFFGDKSLPSLSIKDPLDGKMQVELRCVKKDGTRGHQTVIPGSIHPVTGERIEFHPDSASTIPFAEAEELQYITRGVGALALIAKYFPAEGDRHKCILALARVFCQAGKPLEGALQFILLAYRYSRGYNHDLPKVEADIRSVYRTFEESPETHLYGLPTLVEIIPAVVVNKVLELLDIETPNTKPIEQPEQPEAAPSYSLDDIGNAQRFVQQNRGRVRYCLDEACWYVDDGRRWRKDNAQAIRELAKEIGPMIEAEANKLTSPVITGDEQADAQALRDSHLYKKALLKWANQTKCLKGMSNMLIVASSDPRIACYRSDFDKQPYLLNSWNGVIDLRTGKLLISVF